MKVDIELESVVGPRAELHLTFLDVEREVPNVDTACGAEDGGRDPRNAASVADDRHAVTVLSETRIGTVSCAQTVKRFAVLDLLL